MKKNKTKQPKLLLSGHISFSILICNVNVWEILVQNIARITVIKFLILNTQDEKYTADSPWIRPHSNKISSNLSLMVYILAGDVLLQKYM